ncbi:MAG: alcohol dehydrogenase catalytic domain-containing protein [Planctomycetes bacterium]|nr:alcohol dehydrogenase catalytic domain-containing protein [Planctomycetota bacterium]
MHAVYFDGNNLLYKKFKEPYPAAEEVKVRFEFGGICSTDLEILKGYKGFVGVIGHEVVGTVVSAPGVPEIINKRIVFNINISCNKNDCPYCSDNLQKHCISRKTVGINEYFGAFSEYFLLPLFNIVTLPNNLNPLKAVFAEPLAAALEPVERGLITQNDEIAIFGVGKLGTLALLALQALNYNVIGVVTSEKRREFLLSRFPHLKISLFKNVVGRFDVIFEATGSANNLGNLLNYVKPQGKLILKSTLTEIKLNKENNKRELINVFTAHDINNIVINEIGLFGSRCGNIQHAVDLLASGDIDPTPLITAKYPLAKAGIAFKKAANNSGEKVILYQDSIDEII